MKRVIVSCIICLVGLVACSSAVPDFNGDNAYVHIVNQCDLGPRNPGSDGIELARNYIIATLSALDAEISQQHFTGVVRQDSIPGVNIIASFYPQMSRRILLGAHYDTRPWADKEEDPALHNTPILGGNDGASGVAVLLEIARVLAEKAPQQFGVDLVFFDLEDSGNYGDNFSWCQGSQYFAENIPLPTPEKAIVVDMIGDADQTIYMDYFSYHNCPILVKEVWETAHELGFSSFSSTIKQAIYDDHYPLIQKGMNAIVIIDFDYPVWHTLADTPEQCSAESLDAMGETLLHIIYRQQ